MPFSLETSTIIKRCVEDTRYKSHGSPATAAVGGAATRTVPWVRVSNMPATCHHHQSYQRPTLLIGLVRCRGLLHCLALVPKGVHRTRQRCQCSNPIQLNSNAAISAIFDSELQSCGRPPNTFLPSNAFVSDSASPSSAKFFSFPWPNLRKVDVNQGSYSSAFTSTQPTSSINQQMNE